MPKFTLTADGMAPVQQGIGNIFKSLVQAPLIQQQMQDQTALRNAQMYNANMSGNKHGAEAESERYTLGQRKAVPDTIAADPNMPTYLQAAYKLFGQGVSGNMDQFAKASGEFQTQGIRDQAVANADNVDQMNRLNTLAQPGKTYEPFTNIGNTGTALNKATGAGAVASSTLDKLFGDKTKSEIGENNAQAGAAGASAENSRASADRNRASTDFIRTKNSNAQTPGGKPLTAAQLRVNAEIEAARESLAGMDESDMDALLKKDSFSLTSGDKNALGLIKRARQAKYGEPDIPTVSPKPTPPAPPKEPGLWDKTMGKLFGTANTAPAKNASAAPAAPKMDSNKEALLQQAKEAIARGAPKDKVLQRLNSMGVDSSGL